MKPMLQKQRLTETLTELGLASPEALLREVRAGKQEPTHLFPFEKLRWLTDEQSSKPISGALDMVCTLLVIGLGMGVGQAEHLGAEFEAQREALRQWKAERKAKRAADKAAALFLEKSKARKKAKEQRSRDQIGKSMRSQQHEARYQI